MLRISKVLSNSQTTILRAEGEVREEDLSLLVTELESLREKNGRQIVVDLSAVSFVATEAVDALKDFLGRQIYFMACRPLVRNLFQAGGLSAMILD